MAPSPVVDVVSPSQVMSRGLTLVRFPLERQRVRRSKNLERFKAHFGSVPVVYSMIWSDLQSHGLVNVAENGDRLEDFLVAVFFLKVYPKENPAEGTLGLSDTHIRKLVWKYIPLIGQLLSNKIGFPVAWNPDDSEAKEYLYDLVINNKIPPRAEMAPKDVYEKFCAHRPEFALHGKKNFATRLRTMRKRIEVKVSRALQDEQDLAHDRLIYPMPTTNTKGKLYFAESEVRKALFQDLEQGLLDEMTKNQLYLLRPLYYGSGYNYEEFRKKIHETVRSAKFLKYCEDQKYFKKNKKQGTRKKTNKGDLDGDIDQRERGDSESDNEENVEVAVPINLV